MRYAALFLLVLAGTYLYRERFTKRGRRKVISSLDDLFVPAVVAAAAVCATAVL